MAKKLIEGGECFECKSEIYSKLVKSEVMWACGTCGEHGPISELEEIPADTDQ